MTTTAVRERPILMSAEMVRAILDGRKTMTRREIRKQPVPGCDGQHPDHRVIWNGSIGKTNERVEERWQNDELVERRTFHLPVAEWLMEMCPYQVGMQLWVRESFSICSFGAGTAQVQYAADRSFAIVSDRKLPNRCGSVPSIHMPRQASRITLELTDVRVEQLGDISEAGAIAEGLFQRCGDVHPQLTEYCCGDGFWTTKPRVSFQRLWEKINGAWNPELWVWAITFKPVEAVK